jgi:hypothetical protein
LTLDDDVTPTPLRPLAESVTPGTLVLYVLLGLPSYSTPVCQGYVNACVCEGCSHRQERAAKLAPAQPWQAQAA